MNMLLSWAGERRRDFVRWPQVLLRYLPGRLIRLGQAVVAPARTTGPDGTRPAHCLPPLADRLHRLLIALFDLLGGPEAVQWTMHLAMRTSPLTSVEIAIIAGVLGPDAIAYQEVRIASGGILSLIFRLNGGRAFATWHTIHLPEDGREDLSLLVHEATHVYQYERLGSAYIGEALYAQRQLGRACYDYGGLEGLAAGAPYPTFNREAQAQIAQDFYRYHTAGKDVSLFLPYIAALRQTDL